MAEMLVVMAIITVLAGALAVVLPRLRTNAMMRRAEADIKSTDAQLRRRAVARSLWVRFIAFLHVDPSRAVGAEAQALNSPQGKLHNGG